MNIDHYDIRNTRNDNKEDSIRILSVTDNGNDTYDISLLLNKLSKQTINFLATNNNRCYILMTYRHSSQNGYPRDATIVYPRQHEKRHWYSSAWYTAKLVNITTTSNARVTFTMDKTAFLRSFYNIQDDYYETGLRLDFDLLLQKYGFITREFKFRFVLVPSTVGVSSVTHGCMGIGHVTPYSDFNSDTITMYFR